MYVHLSCITPLHPTEVKCQDSFQYFRDIFFTLTVLLEDESEQAVTLVKLSSVMNCHEVASELLWYQ